MTTWTIMIFDPDTYDTCAARNFRSLERAYEYADKINARYNDAPPESTPVVLGPVPTGPKHTKHILDEFFLGEGN